MHKTRVKKQKLMCEPPRKHVSNIRKNKFGCGSNLGIIGTIIVQQLALDVDSRTETVGQSIQERCLAGARAAKNQHKLLHVI